MGSCPRDCGLGWNRWQCCVRVQIVKFESESESESSPPSPSPSHHLGVRVQKEIQVQVTHRCRFVFIIGGGGGMIGILVRQCNFQNLVLLRPNRPLEHRKTLESRRPVLLTKPSH